MKSKRGIFKLVTPCIIGLSVLVVTQLLQAKAINSTSKLPNEVIPASETSMDFVSWQEVEKESSKYPLWASWVQSPTWKWQPWEKWDLVGRLFGVNFDLSEDDCPLLKEGSAQKLGLEFFQKVQECEKSARTWWKPGWVHGLGTIGLYGEVKAIPEARPILFSFKDQVSQKNIKLRAFLALQKTEEKRPLVVLRVGIFSNSFEFYPEKYLLQQLYKEGGFHMLIVESTSNPFFSSRNAEVSLKLVAESVQTKEVLTRILEDKELSPKISDVHVVGVSLGGYGVLRMAVEDTDSVVKSYTLMCPLAEMEKTFLHHRQNPVMYKIINKWAEQRFQKESEDLLGENIDLFEKHDISFQDFQKIKKPIMIFASENDDLVPFSINTGAWLGDKDLLVDGNKAIVRMKTGTHCSVPSAYNWKASGAWLRSFIKASALE